MHWRLAALALIGVTLAIVLRGTSRLDEPDADIVRRDEAAGTAPYASWDLLTLVRRQPSPPTARASVGRLYGETRTAVAIQVGTHLTQPIAIPPRAVLDLGYALESSMFMTQVPRRAEPTRVRIVFVDAEGQRHVLLDHVIDIRDREAERRWFDQRIDLTRFGGKAGILELGAALEDGSKRATHMRAFFSAPRVLRSPRQDEPSVLFVTIDCLRADHVAAYGYHRPTTPTLDRLAAEGIRFARAFASGPTTLPSIPQIFTSDVFPAPGQPTLISSFAIAGIPNAAIIKNPWIDVWLTFGKDGTRPDTFDRLIALPDDGQTHLITDRAIEWLELHREDRFALYLHYLDPHSPYSLYPPSADQFGDPSYRGPVDRTFNYSAGVDPSRYDERDRARVVSLYDAGIRYADENLGRVIEHLRADGRLERTVVVVSADHGEELWDHGAFFHGQSLYDELLHVPLLVRLPGAALGGKVIDQQVRSIDIAPAVLEWARLPRPASFRGRSLAEAVARPSEPGEPAISAATTPQFPARYAIRTGRYKLIETLSNGALELYDLASDPGEIRNLAGERVETGNDLLARLYAEREVLRRRGYQARVVGPGEGSNPADFRLILSNTAATGTFINIDRTSGPRGSMQISLSPDGRTLAFDGRADSDGSGFRFERKLDYQVALGSQPDPVSLKFESTAGGLTLQLGARPEPLSTTEVNLRDPSLEAPVPPSCPPSQGGVRLCLWRSSDAELVGEAIEPDAATRERLRALGYAQ